MPSGQVQDFFHRLSEASPLQRRMMSDSSRSPQKNIPTTKVQSLLRCLSFDPSVFPGLSLLYSLDSHTAGPALSGMCLLTITVY